MKMALGTCPGWGSPSALSPREHPALLTLRPSPSLPAAGRLKTFKAALLDVFREAHAQSVGMNRLTESISRGQAEPFSAEEIQAALSKMQDDNQVMVSEGIVFLI